MRVLHTGDWHVGRTIRGRSRADEHAAVLDEIVAIAADQDVDVVLVAGDLFDTAAPTPEAEQIVYGTLLALADAGRQVVALAGNHDNPGRLEAVAEVFAASRVRLQPFFAPAASGGVVELEAGGDRCRIAALPWLSKRFVVSADALMDHDKAAADHEGHYASRIGQLVQSLTSSFAPDAVNIALAHLTAVGGMLGGGEREAHTVFEYAVPAAVFPGSTNYVALGHLHRVQQIDHGAPVWYPGSPLQLDFGEGRDDKVVLVFEAKPGLPVGRVQPIGLSAGRRLRTIEGSLAELRTHDGLTGRDHLRVIVEEPARAGLAEEVQAMFPHAVEIRVVRDAGPSEAARPQRLGRSSRELFAEYLVERDADDERVRALFDELHEDASVAPS